MSNIDFEKISSNKNFIPFLIYMSSYFYLRSHHDFFNILLKEEGILKSVFNMDCNNYYKNLQLSETIREEMMSSLEKTIVNIKNQINKEI